MGDITRQQQIASGSGVEPTNFPDGTTSIGDLRTVTAPRVFTYSQTNVPIYYYASTLVVSPPVQVGSYNFNMTINLGAPANRQLNANATNINVSGGPWPYAAVTNAKAFLAVQKEFGSFDAYVWGFTGGKTIQNRWKDKIPASTAESDAMSKDLKKRGFTFVGSTICYAFMQATGMVNDHMVNCFRHKELA